MTRRTVAERALTYGSVAAASALVGAGSVWVGGATYFARRVLTPDPIRPDDSVIHVVHTDSVTLSGTPDLVVPGRYGLWLDGGRGHARIGGVLEVDHRRQRVRRELLGVDVAGLHHARGVGFVDKRQQEMFERREFVAARIGQRKRCVDGLLKSVRE